MSLSTNTIKSGFAAIIGRPNVGKSTLLNEILDFKLSIVTAKPQTTRHKIVGILNAPDLQIVFFDTPGILKPKYKLHDVMLQTVHSAVADADLVLLMVDATDDRSRFFVEDTVLPMLGRYKKAAVSCLLAINKIDRVNKSLLLPMIDAYAGMNTFREIIPISALRNDGVELVVKAMRTLLPEAPPYYPQDALTEQPERFFVSELIRETIFNRFKDEIPYSTDVAIEDFVEKEGAKDVIRAVIYVEKSSQKAILIGKKGTSLKEVGIVSRKAIESFLGRPVFLELWVKVRDKWRRDGKVLRDLGYQ